MGINHETHETHEMLFSPSYCRRKRDFRVFRVFRGSHPLRPSRPLREVFFIRGSCASCISWFPNPFIPFQRFNILAAPESDEGGSTNQRIHSHTFTIFMFSKLPLSNCLRAKCKGQFHSVVKHDKRTRYAMTGQPGRKKNSRLVGGQFPLHFSRDVVFNKIKSGFDFIVASGSRESFSFASSGFPNLVNLSDRPKSRPVRAHRIRSTGHVVKP